MSCPRRFLASIILPAVFLAACSTSPAATSAPTPTVSSLAPYASQLRGAVIDPPRTLTNVELAATTGDTFRLSDYRGDVVLMYFGYRSCPDFCPTTFAELKQVYEALGEPADRLKIVFVTIDPERDTLDLLTLYTQAFHPDFIGVRGENDVLQTMYREFGVVANRREVGSSAMSYLFDHTASIFLIGPDGRLEAQYLYGTSPQVLIHDVELILESINEADQT